MPLYIYRAHSDNSSNYSAVVTYLSFPLGEVERGGAPIALCAPHFLGRRRRRTLVVRVLRRQN